MSLTIYAVLLTIAVLGFIAFKIYKYFNKVSLFRKNEKERLSKLKKDYQNVLNQEINVNNPTDGGMPGGESVGSIDEL